MSSTNSALAAVTVLQAVGTIVFFFGVGYLAALVVSRRRLAAAGGVPGGSRTPWYARPGGLAVGSALTLAGLGAMVDEPYQAFSLAASALSLSFFATQLRRPRKATSGD